MPLRKSVRHALSRLGKKDWKTCSIARSDLESEKWSKLKDLRHVSVIHEHVQDPQAIIAVQESHVRQLEAHEIPFKSLDVTEVWAQIQGGHVSQEELRHRFGPLADRLAEQIVEKKDSNFEDYLRDIIEDEGVWAAIMNGVEELKKAHKLQKNSR